MAESTVNFANIVATPTSTAWSQTYIAGKLSAVLSLEKSNDQTNEHFLPSLGKDVISTLEQEFFTLENKDLDSIKNAIQASIEKIQNVSSFSYVITFVAGNVMYIFIAGKGSVILKRGSKIGTVLESNDDNREIKSASGFLQEGDLVILASSAFSNIVPMSTLASSLDHQDPSNIVENLAPKIHEKQEGGASAIVFTFKEKGIMPVVADGETADDSSDLMPNTETIPPIPSEELEKTKEPETPTAMDDLDEPQENKTSPVEPEGENEDEGLFPKLDDLAGLEDQLPPLSQSMEAEPQKQEPIGNRRKFSFPRIRFPRISFSHRRRIFLTITVVILAVLIGSIFFALKSRNDNQTKTLFASIYPQAQEKYNEGKALEDLNPSLATDDLNSAKKILTDNQDKFSKGSSEQKQVSDLLSKVSQALNAVGTSPTSSLKEVSASTSDLLSIELNNPSVAYFTKDDKNVYFLDGAGIQEVTIANNKKTQIVKKSWTTPAGIGIFLGNLYVLDTDASQIFKFASSTFAKSNYLNAKIDLSNAIDMTIDGAIYILNKDGSIDKYLRGDSQTFAVSGLTKPIGNSAKIRTDADITNLYILDKGNSRVVVLSKTGKFVAEYPAPIIKEAKDFDVQEANKKIYILSSGKVYQLDLK